jgi:nicotinamidase-related amidase
MAKRALIVIDVQNEYFDGALPITDPPREQSLENIGRARDAATAAGVPVIVVRHGTKDASEGIFL